MGRDPGCRVVMATPIKDNRAVICCSTIITLKRTLHTVAQIHELFLHGAFIFLAFMSVVREEGDDLHRFINQGRVWAVATCIYRLLQRCEGTFDEGLCCIACRSSRGYMMQAWNHFAGMCVALHVLCASIYLECLGAPELHVTY